MEDELRRCPVCGEPVERLVQPPGRDKVLRMRTLCACERAEEEARERADQAARFRLRMRQLRERFPLSDGCYRQFTFQNDDCRDERLSQTCRQYVEQWEQMRRENIGLLFHGPPGTGKSFLAGAIVNALLERQVSAVMTSLPRLLNLLQGSRDRQELIDSLRSYELLVVDDLGVERESPYTAEQVYGVIDARVRARLPVLVTTNLTMEELRSPPTMQAARIYDRVLELCPVTLKLTGGSRRTENAAGKRERARALLSAGEGG